MAMMRNFCSTLLLVPVGLLASHVAGATTTTTATTTVTPASIGAPSASPVQLPEGVHRNAHGRYTRDMCDHKKKIHCLSQIVLPEDWTPGKPIPQGAEGYGGASGMSPSDVIAAYNLQQAPPSGGKVVAIIDEPDSHAYSDLSAYRSAYGLPTIPKCPAGTTPSPGNQCFAQVNENGGASSGDSGSADGETALDMDMISAACPDCGILLVDLTQDYDTPVKQAIALGAVAVSISFGSYESGSDTNDFTTNGHLVLAASGDYGYDNVNMGSSRTPSYPSSAPSILAVGGTALYNNGGGTYLEGVWNDGTFSTGQAGQDVTTSGCSTEFGMPSWQAAGLAGTGCNKRATADLSAAATFFSGGSETAINCYDATEGGMVPVEGTSAASPLVAALFTRVGLAEKIADSLASGGTNWVYDNPSGFYDISTSSSRFEAGAKTTDAKSTTTCSNKLCTIADGWDGPTGVGSPNGAALVTLAAGGTTSSSSSSTPPQTSSSSSAATQPGSGTGTSTPVQTSTGTTTPVTTSTGVTPPSSGSGTGTVGTGGSVGAACTGGGDCVSALCAALSATAAAVCTQQCTTAVDCPVGFGCTGGYCFASGASETASTGTSKGCAVSPGSGSTLAGLGWLSVGLLAFLQRRRSRKG